MLGTNQSCGRHWGYKSMLLQHGPKVKQMVGHMTHKSKALYHDFGIEFKSALSKGKQPLEYKSSLYTRSSLFQVWSCCRLWLFVMLFCFMNQDSIECSQPPLSMQVVQLVFVNPQDAPECLDLEKRIRETDRKGQELIEMTNRSMAMPNPKDLKIKVEVAGSLYLKCSAS